MKNKSSITLLEILIGSTIGLALFALVFSFYGGLTSDYTWDEIFRPEQTKAKYQRQMVEELRRANDLKEREQHERD